jgi:hypothetical protein
MFFADVAIQNLISQESGMGDRAVTMLERMKAFLH